MQVTGSMYQFPSRVTQDLSRVHSGLAGDGDGVNFPALRVQGKA
jgi:hypothetical protein